MAKQTPWAVLYCKFSDDVSDPTLPDGRLIDISFFKRLFTTSGSGTNNMVDFFRGVSHGNIDISGSEVFGPYILDEKQKGAGQVGFVNLAKNAALADNVLLNRFYSVVVCLNVQYFTFWNYAVGAAVLDIFGQNPSIAGQEMGHGYGLDHSRSDGSSADYTDSWDVMSTGNAHMTPDPIYGWIGPGLNAANMRSRGWLDETRVWRSSVQTHSSVVELRPLFRQDLPGLLAAQAGSRPYLVEFRVKASWDAAIPRSAILIHRFEDNHSYLMANTAGGFDLAQGDVFEAYTEGNLFSFRTRVEVLRIDEAGQKATVRIGHRRIGLPPDPAGPVQGYLGAAAGLLQLLGSNGWGLFIAPGGKPFLVPPGDPLAPILEQFAAYLSADLLLDLAVRDAVRRSTLTQIAAYVEAAIEKSQPFRIPAPLKVEESPAYDRGSDEEKPHDGAPGRKRMAD